VLLVAGCATTTVSLQRDAEQCESFATFDARVRGELDALLSSAPGDQLVKESSRLNLARRACARHVLGELRTTRERAGIEAVQRELDALTVTYREEDLRALIDAALGEDAAQLGPLLQEAKQRTTREAAAGAAAHRDDAEREHLKVDGPSSLGPEPELPSTLCAASQPCEQLDCVLEHDGAFELPARACLDTLTALAPHARADALSALLSKLPSRPGPARTEAQVALQTLERQLWAEVEAAVAAKQPGRAAQLASLLRGLPARRARIEQLRDAAQAHHLARAKELSAFPDAVWLHRALAESFGGPPAPEVPKTAGTWESTSRWRCKSERPALPPVPTGLKAVLNVRCQEPAKVDGRPDGMRTFELERQLAAERVTGSLTVLCGAPNVDRSSHTLQADDVAALPEEVARLLETSLGACVRIHRYAATRSCTELNTLSVGELLSRFVTHHRFTNRWEPCFVEWLLATEGVAPP
jgi:hypothetical protein